MTTPAGLSAAAPYVDLTELPAARPVSLGPGGAGGKALTIAGLLLGWSVYETSGAAVATMLLRDGTDASGQLLAAITLAAGGHDTVPIAPPGLVVRDGLFADVKAGAVTGVAWVIPLAPGA